MYGGDESIIDIRRSIGPEHPWPGGRRRPVPIAVLSSSTFDIRTIDVNTETFGRSGGEDSLLVDSSTDLNESNPVVVPSTAATATSWDVESLKDTLNSAVRWRTRLRHRLIRHDTITRSRLASTRVTVPTA